MIRSLAGLLCIGGILGCCSIASWSRNAEPPPISLSVYVDGAAHGPPQFAVSTDYSSLEVASAAPLPGDRPLLLVIDPTSYPRDELRAHVDALARELVRRAPGPEFSVRFGFTVLDGLLGAPVERAGLREALDLALSNYVSDGLGSRGIDVARALEITSNLLRKSAEDGPVDVLLLAKDREPTDSLPSYVGTAMERRLVFECLRHGSTLYVYAGGEGLLGRAGAASGGEVFSHSGVQPGDALRRVLDARAKGFLLRLKYPAGLPVDGRIELAVQAPRTVIRAPSAIWLMKDGSLPPGYADVIQSLELIRRGRDAAATSDFSSAMQYLERAMEGDPWNGNVYAGMACVALERDDLAAARGYAARSMHTLPREHDAVLVYADIFERLGRAAEALEEIRKAKQQARDPALQHVLGRLLASTRQYEEASRMYSALLRSGQADDRIHAEYGWILLKTGDLTGAAQRFHAALAQNPECLKALSGEAELALIEKRIPEALELGNRALKIHPGSPEALLQVAKGLVATEKWDEAASSLEVVSKDPALAGEALPLLVDARLRAGRPGDAEELLVRHLGENPYDTDLHRRLAEVRVLSGNLEGAAGGLESGAARISAPKHEFYLEAAELRERRGEFGQALLDYRAALDAAPPETASRLSDSLGPHMHFLSVLMGGTPDRPAPESGQAPPLQDRQLPDPILRNTSEGSKPANDDLLLPGGRNFLARTMGIPESALEGPDAVERVFFHILAAGPARSRRADENPLHRSVLTTLKHYSDLTRHLVKLGLLHKDSDPETEQTFVFPLAGPDVKIARTEKFLSFFGVDYKYHKSDNSVSLTMKQNRRSEERQAMLRNLGVDLMNRNLRVIQLALRDERIPVLLGSDTWKTAILGKDKDRPLFERMLRAPEAMALYVALANCSEAARQALLGAGAGADLAGMSDLLFAFGRYLEVRDGRVVVPGNPLAWQSLIGAPVTEPRSFMLELLRRDGGRAIQLLQSLLFADDSVQRFLTDSPERFQQFYRLLSPYDNGKSDSWNRGTSRQEPGRLLRLVSADDRGLFMRIDARWGRYLANFTKAAVPGEQTGRLRLDLASLAGLLNRAVLSGPTYQTSVIEILELISYIETARPEMLDDAAVAALLQNPALSPLALNLIWDVSPSPQLLAKYLHYCRELVEMPENVREWKNNRTRSSQAVLYLLSALSREGVLGITDANRLMQEALNRFSSPNEAQFGRALAGFVSEQLLPALTRQGRFKTDDVLMEALAGKAENIEFLFEGKGLQLEPHAFRLQRMKAAIQHQSILPLANLLSIYALSRTDDKAGVLVSELEKLGKQRQFAEVSKRDLKEIPHGDLDGVARLARDAAARGAIPADLRDKLARELHVELGITLLSYCYAYHGTPEIDLLTFDPHFVRKHQFYVEYTQPDIWRTAYLEQQEKRGSILTGSLSGLAFELGRLETSQSGQVFGTAKGPGLVPSILAGMRAVPSILRSTRAQEYIALTVRVGLEAAVRSAIDPEMKEWCGARFRQMMSPRRREALTSWLERPDARPEAQALSRSELFLLGQAYLQEPPGSAPELRSPVLERVREILPAPGTPEEARLHREVEQYGVHLRSRIGLDQLSFSLADPYEVLERNLRDEVLFERICDLKIRIAELNHSLGLPAALAGFEGELALRDILPDSNQLRVSTWMAAVEQIARLNLENVRGWIDELVNRACIREVPDTTVAANEVGR